MIARGSPPSWCFSNLSVLPKGVCGVWLLAPQKPKTGQVGGKESLLISHAENCGGRGWQMAVQRLTPSGCRDVLEREVEGVTAWRNSTVISDSHFQTIISSLTSIILVVLGIISSSRVHLSPFLCSQFLESWQLTSWAQSGHHVANFPAWWFSICKTAHRIWLRILSVALEKELKVLGYA